MFYVIPSWYGDHTHNSFDDAIQHVKLFQAAGEVSQLVVLAYLPQLRYFLHQKDLFELPTWSLFDAVQGVLDVNPRLLSFRELSWPEGTAFSFTPFLIMAYQAGQLLAHVHLGDDGQLKLVHYFEDGQLLQSLTMDDRGFISAVSYYQNGQASHKDYLNRYGIWQFRERLTDGDQSVLVNPEADYPFQRQSYASLAELQAEAIETYLKTQVTERDTVLIASDQRHNETIFSSLSRAKIILSFFTGREASSQQVTPKMIEQMNQSDVIIADRKSLVNALQAVTNRPVVQVSPFDTRLRLGHSQQFKEQYLYVVLDGLSVTDQRLLVETLFELMASDESLYLFLVSYQTDPAAKAGCQRQISEWLEEADCPYLFLEEQGRPKNEEGDQTKSRVSLHQTMNEQELIQLLDKARLVIDLADEPDLYTQIAAISAGLPQVNRHPSEFVVHQQNGYIIDTISQLSEVHAYYLLGLRHWNEALVYATQKLAAYTSGRLVTYLKEQIGLRDNE